MNFENEPAIGTTQQTADGQTWRKTHTLGQDRYQRALADAHWALRVGKPVTAEHLRAMGFVLVGGVE